MKTNTGVSMRSCVRADFLKGAFLAVGLLLTAAPASAAIIFQDDFSTGNISKKLNGAAFWTDNSSNYQQPSATKLSSITVQPEVGGGYSVRALYAGTTNVAEGARPELRFTLGGQYPELWISYKVYIPANYYHRNGAVSSNNKFFIIDNMIGSQFMDFETFPVGNGSDVANMQLKYNGVNHDFQGGASQWYVGTPEDRGAWHYYVLHLKVATSATASDGVSQAWKDGNLVRQFLNLPNYTPGANYFEEGYIFGASNSGFAVDTELRLDDITFATTPPLGGPHWMP